MPILLFVASFSAIAADHVVTDEVPNLSEITLYLYGTSRGWTRLAEWNGLTEPYALKPGQKLTLKEEPAVTPERGMELVLRDRDARSAPLARAHALLSRGRADEALASIDASLAQEPDSFASRLLRLRILCDLGRRDELAQGRAELIAAHPEAAELAWARELPASCGGSR